MTRMPAWLHVVPVLLALALGPVSAASAAENVLLFDFEDGTQNWENETDGTVTPARAEISADVARHGRRSLMFRWRFGKKTHILHCRVKEDFDREVAQRPGFRAFSAWVFIPKGGPHWEAKMFVRSGPTWEWGEGETRRKLEPGWHRVEIPLEMIEDPQLVQDLGVQVIYYTDDLETPVYIDQVEGLMTDPGRAGKP